MPGKSAIALVGLALLLPGCSEERTWHGRDLGLTNPEWRNLTLEPGWSFRWDVIVQEGMPAEWDWFVDNRVPTKFAVLRHSPAGLETLETVEADNHSGRRVTDRTALHSFIWTNGHEGGAEVWFRVADAVDGGYYPPGSDPRTDPCLLAAVVIC
jgi:hypothetical protein